MRDMPYRGYVLSDADDVIAILRNGAVIDHAPSVAAAMERVDEWMIAP